MHVETRKEQRQNLMSQEKYQEIPDQGSVSETFNGKRLFSRSGTFHAVQCAGVKTINVLEHSYAVTVSSFMLKHVQSVDQRLW